MSDPVRTPNHLINEKSPYLLQHAYNPVQWYPWGQEAFDKAREKDKPIFLSIGYSTCHWCHVMERESFEDLQVAELMNETFVSIKVDREERPDIDALYMKVCQMMIGSGGWPLTVIMTPEKKPFFAITYIPKQGRYGLTGMLTLIPRIRRLWEKGRSRLETNAERIISALQKKPEGSTGGNLDESTLERAYDQLSTAFDERSGGFGVAPKFPTAHNLLFLLRYWRRKGQKKALHMVEKTLQVISHGGIFDHVGFGVHRYSTDENWLVPHFEKMLYDQALLTMAYIGAYQATSRDEYRETAQRILAHVLRDMTSPEGGFYSALDAESEGEEGKYYLWTEDEIRKALSPETAELIVEIFNVEKEGNFTEQQTRMKTGKNILHLRKSLLELSDDLKIGLEALKKLVEEALQKLLNIREKRVPPLKDDKILTNWNGLMIAALAKAAQAFDNPQYTEVAEKAVKYVLENMRDSEGRLLHRFRGGEAAVHAFLDDYTFLVWGLLELYETTFNVHYLRLASDLTEDLLAHFWDEEGGFFFTADDSEKLLIRSKEVYDGAIPSGNSVAMLNLLRLGRMTSDPRLEERAIEMSKVFSEQVSPSPRAYTQMMVALDFLVGPSYELVIAGNPQSSDTVSMLSALRKKFVPNKVVLLVQEGEIPPEISPIAEFTKDYKSLDGKATAYVCRNYSCELPTTEIEDMLKLLK